ncbi:DUF6746 family protein [Nitrosomonas sp. Nm51]|uniref:DUF6746 family protein n=1 Tax=Nitrosomonas sp. Nm51 TaxID=133720 RepID=UPI000B84C437|nr:DUF6746 family protein [Nitrosomonas sp. Nm51]
MKKKVFMAMMALFLFYATVIKAEEKQEHFKGKPSETIEQAVSNFSEYNRKLSSILNQDTLSPRDMQQVHELTYTLENALEKINSTLSTLSDTLEAVHVSSETGDADAMQTEGMRYLDTARQIIE